MLIQLPNGFIDGQDLFDYADIDELRGKQQNYLVDRELVSANIGHIPKILEDVVQSFQTKEGLVWKGNKAELIDKLTFGDIETLLIKIRENTYGPRFYLEANCTHCEKLNKNLRIDLDKLEMQKLSLEQLTHKHILELPKCKKQIELKPICLKDMFNIIKLTVSKKTDNVITTLAAISIKRIDNNTSVKAEDIADLPASDIYYINKKLEELKLNGIIDTDIEAECTECKKDFISKLNVVDPNFFDPSKGYTS